MIEEISVDYKNRSGILKCENPSTFKLIREHFSVPNPNYKMRHFSPRQYVITPAGAFQVGLWYDIEKYIMSLGKKFSIRQTAEFYENYKPQIKNIDIVATGEHPYYDYQEAAIHSMLDNGRGIVLVATSGGKTKIMAGLIKSILAKEPFAKFLVVVPTSGLLNQTYNDFVDSFGLESVERWGDKLKPTFEESVLVALHNIMWQDLEYTISQLKDYDYVLIDEVHTIGEKESKSKGKNGEKKDKHLMSKIIHNIDTPNKWGLTGTLPDNKLACWNIIGKVGAILFERKSWEIRQQGKATDIFINVIHCIHKNSPPDPTKTVIKDGIPYEVPDEQPVARYNAERVWLYQNAERNEMIRRLAIRSIGNGMILVDNIEQGQILEKLLCDQGKTVFFIWSGVDSEDRQKIIKLMEEKSDIVAIAMSKCFSTGISINNLHWLIFPSIGKSTVKIMQSIGRSMRLHESKDLAKIYDFSDNTSYSARHVKKRLKLYNDEKIEFKVKKIEL